VGRVTGAVVAAHAKINVMLRVLGRRDDGYHDVETLVLPVDLHDDVEVSPADRLEVELFGPYADRVAGDDELAAAAVAALAARERREPAVRIRIDKRIPVGAGMGGGSADAAAALRAAAALWGLPDGPAALGPIAADIGSDVPALLHGGAALASGRGERVAPVHAATTVWAVHPFDLQVRAADAYRWWDESGAMGPDPGVAAAALEAGNVDVLGEAISNDLQPGVTSRHPEVGLAIEAFLEAGALGAVMTGSGPTVVALGRHLGHATTIAGSVPGSFVVVGPPPSSERLS
jgi:4-diphosphocytidyl-2-C-methyl-D-erythritol kinase